MDGGVKGKERKAFTNNWRLPLNSHHINWAISLCLDLAVVVPDVLLASSSSSFAWRGSSVQTPHSLGPPQAAAACQTVWGIWSSGSPGRAAGRADGVAPASESSSASVADVLLAGQLFLLCTSLLLAQSRGLLLLARSTSCVDKPGSSGIQLFQSVGLDGSAPDGAVTQHIPLTQGLGLSASFTELQCDQLPVRNDADSPEILAHVLANSPGDDNHRNLLAPP